MIGKTGIVGVVALVLGLAVACGSDDLVPTTSAPSSTSTRSAPISSPTVTASQEPSVGQEEAFPGERYQILRAALTVPGWTFTDNEVGGPDAKRQCDRNWAKGPGGRWAGRNLSLGVAGGPPAAWAEDSQGFVSAAQASKAADRLVANLESCAAASWRSRPVGRTGAVPLTTGAGALWVRHGRGSVAALFVATSDGPPPLGVQVEVAALIYSWWPNTPCWHRGA